MYYRGHPSNMHRPALPQRMPRFPNNGNNKPSFHNRPQHFQNRPGASLARLQTSVPRSSSQPTRPQARNSNNFTSTVKPQTNTPNTLTKSNSMSQSTSNLNPSSNTYSRTPYQSQTSNQGKQPSTDEQKKTLTQQTPASSANKGNSNDKVNPQQQSAQQSDNTKHAQPTSDPIKPSNNTVRQGLLSQTPTTSRINQLSQSASKIPQPSKSQQPTFSKPSTTSGNTNSSSIDSIAKRNNDNQPTQAQQSSKVNSPNINNNLTGSGNRLQQQQRQPQSEDRRQSTNFAHGNQKSTYANRTDTRNADTVVQAHQRFQKRSYTGSSVKLNDSSVTKPSERFSSPSSASATRPVIPMEGSKTSNGRTRLFVGNIPTDMTEKELKDLACSYGNIVEVFLNSQRGFAFLRYDRKVSADEAKSALDGLTVRGKMIRVRFAVNGAAVRIKNIPDFVSNELLAEAFSFFGRIERAVVIVDDRGKPTGEGIVEFDRKNSALTCITKCTENCFVLTNELKPVCVEQLPQVDEEDGLPERTLQSKSEAYLKARSQMPRFLQPGTFEHTVCSRWKELEEQRKQMEAQVKERIDLSREQLKIEIEQMNIEHQTYLLREDLARRESELRYLEEQRRHELERKKSMIQQVIQHQQQQFEFGQHPGVVDQLMGGGNVSARFQGNSLMGSGSSNSGGNLGGRMHSSSSSSEDMNNKQQLAAVYAASKHQRFHPTSGGGCSSIMQTNDSFSGYSKPSESSSLLYQNAASSNIQVYHPSQQAQQQFPLGSSGNVAGTPSSAHGNLLAAAAVLNSAGLISPNILQSNQFFKTSNNSLNSSPQQQHNTTVSVAAKGRNVGDGRIAGNSAGSGHGGSTNTATNLLAASLSACQPSSSAAQDLMTSPAMGLNFQHGYKNTQSTANMGSTRSMYSDHPRKRSRF